MKTLVGLFLVCMACGSSGEEFSRRPFDAGGATFAGYRCAVLVDAGDCLATFLAGEPSACSYTREGATIQIVRPSVDGYELVATCMP